MHACMREGKGREGREGKGSSGTVSAPQLFASNTLTVTNTSDFSDDLFLTKNWRAEQAASVQQQRGLRQRPELRLLGNQSASVFLERDGKGREWNEWMCQPTAAILSTTLYGNDALHQNVLSNAYSTSLFDLHKKTTPTTNVARAFSGHGREGLSVALGDLAVSLQEGGGKTLVDF